MKIELSEILELNANMLFKSNKKFIELEEKYKQKCQAHSRLVGMHTDADMRCSDLAYDIKAKDKEIEILKHALFATENTISNYDIFTKTINKIIADSKNSSLKIKLLCEIEEYGLDEMVFDSEIKEK